MNPKLFDNTCDVLENMTDKEFKILELSNTIKYLEETLNDLEGEYNEYTPYLKNKMMPTIKSAQKNLKELKEMYDKLNGRKS